MHGLRRRMPVLVAAAFSLFIPVGLLSVPTAVQQAGPVHRVLGEGRPALDDPRHRAPRHLDDPAPFEPAYSSRAEWEARARTVRTQVQVAVGLWPMPERSRLEPVVHGRIERDGYTIEKVFFASLPGHYVTGNLYRPASGGGRRPAVLTPYGHWERGRFLERSVEDAQKSIAMGAEGTLESARYPLQARCAMLARMGFVVFQYDMVGYADSFPIAHREGFLDADAELRLQSFMGLQTWNSIRALDFLASLADVDPARIAVTGESGGGTQTAILCAVDDRPSVAVPVVMISANMQGGCVCENASLLRVATNNVEIAALFAPKPLALIGADDWTHDIETRGFPELRRVYSLFGRESDVVAKHFAFPHNYNQVSREFMYAWLNRFVLAGRRTPIASEVIRERPFVPVPPNELSVFDAAHPRPVDALDAPALRRAMTRAAEAQMSALARRPDEFRRTARAALEALVHDRAQGAFKLVDGSFKSIAGDGFSVHQSVLTRPDGGSRVPTVGLVPAEWRKRAVVIWTHPAGKAAAFEADGRTPVPAVRAMLAGGAAVIAPDVFLTGESAAEIAAVKNEEKYAGFRWGYNRSAFANRVHDLLTVMAFSQTLGARATHLVGVGRAGVWALAARALAGGVIDRAAIDLAGFDFDQVTRTDDEMLLPGAVKYGGVLGMASLCETGTTALYDLPSRPAAPWAPIPSSVTRQTTSPTPERMAEWVLAR